LKIIENLPIMITTIQELVNIGSVKAKCSIVQKEFMRILRIRTTIIIVKSIQVDIF
jgi:hypothetical protein